jgi:hypothetical protein
MKSKLFEEVLSEAKQIEKFELMINVRLQENLEKATLNNVEKLRELGINNADVRKVLTTPIYEQPKYRNLFRNSFWEEPRTKRITLFDAIMSTLEDSEFISYWIEEKEIIGFVSYQELGNIADGVKLFEFNKSISNTMQMDILKFMKDIIESHKITKWEANINNKKAVRSYDIFIKKKEKEGYKISRNEDKIEEVIFYKIERNSTLMYNCIQK